MDFIAQIQELSQQIQKLREKILTKEATKSTFIIPFIKALGYDVFNPLEVCPDFTGDIAGLKGESIDYAIILDDNPIILIECKWCGESLENPKPSSSLQKYFNSTKAKFGLLTNGVLYQFYTDIEKTNFMDEEPFFEFNTLNSNQFLINELHRFSKSSFKSAKQSDVVINFLHTREIKLPNLLANGNQTQADYPMNQCIHQLLESQVELTPDNIAISFEDQQLTYRELNCRANQLAHYLQTLQVGPEVLVGICIKRSLFMAIGLLAILKAGGAYIPLDPAYPEERLAFMLEDSQLPILLTESDQLVKLSNHQTKVVCLDTDWERIAQHSKENPNSGVTPDNLAYTIYTSGSTGKPKGVQILHGAVVNFLTSMSQAPGITERDVLLAVTTISFDIAALELYLPLAVGARVVLVTREVASDAAQLLKALTQSDTTIMQATPATWRLLLAAGWQGCSTLKILCGGEALPRDLANQLLERSASVWNMYGPTETTIWSAVYRVEPGDNPVPIGRPIANTQIYLVDPEQNFKSDPIKLVPVGEPGELLIGGVGLARGYLNRRELTDERFIPDPFSNEPEARLYRTGDLARYRVDSTVEFIGRVDHQVKIRGFRIELGEIESVLRQHPAVQEAVVIAREDVPGDKRLVAYLVADLSAERVPLQGNCLVEWEGSPAITLTTVDFSSSGICLVNVPADWNEGQHLRLRLQLPGVQDELVLEGSLAWRHKVLAGVLFQTKPTEQALLRQSIKQIIQTEGFEVSDLRRVESRVPLQSTCLAEFESGARLELTAQNIGRGGIRLGGNSADIWHEGQRLRLGLQLPGVGDELWLKGTVVWHDGKNAGIEFETTRKEQAQIHQSMEYIIETQGLSLGHLRSFLKEKLPDYMVPSAFVMLDALPLTPNLKVDRKALPTPNHIRSVLEEAFVPPRTPVEEQLAKIWARVLGIEQVGIRDNFFELGGDSLLAAQLLSWLRETFQVELPLLSLFEAPTVAGLAQAIMLQKHSAIADGSTLQAIAVAQDSDSTSKPSRTTVADFQADAVLDSTIAPEAPFIDSGTEPQKIFLTGATGFVGAFLLQELLQQTEASIYCLIRSSSLEKAKQKLRKNLKRYLLPDDKLDTRIVPVLGDLSKPLFGLSEQQFRELTTEIDLIYHNGAFVNLIYPYSALRAANVLGTKEILKLASRIKVKPVHFISTLDVFQSPHYVGMQVILEQDDLANGEGLSDGYAQSKWVAEKLVMAAHSRGIPTCIYRLGTITGHSQTGAFQTDDLIGRLIKGLTQLGSAPDLDLKMSLTPVDYISQAIIHLSHQPASLGKAFHLVSPHVLPFHQLVKEIQALGYSIKWTDYDQWQAQLLNVASSQTENALSPLLFLFTEWSSENQLPYLETAALVSQAFDCQNTLAGLAGTALTCPPVDTRLLRTYFSYLGLEQQLDERV